MVETMYHKFPYQMANNLKDWNVVQAIQKKYKDLHKELIGIFLIFTK